MKILKSDFHFNLPQELIATKPVQPRDRSRMLIVDRKEQSITNANFLDLPDILDQNSLLIANNSKVIPARLEGQRSTGGKIEALLVKEMALGQWLCKVKNSSRIKIGDPLHFAGGVINAVLLEKQESGLCLLHFDDPTTLMTRLEKHAYAPLPPYIHQARGSQAIQREKDLEEYQTLFAQHYGAIAAPTAGLHFSEAVIQSLKTKGILLEEITLHVGLGTFEPIRVDDLTDHQMHKEEFEISPSVVEKIQKAKQEKEKIIALGTTSLRALEGSAAQGGGKSWHSRNRDFYLPPI